MAEETTFHPDKNKIFAAFRKSMDYKIIPDDELVASCLQNIRPAWEEFFRRFIPSIKRGILGVLAAYGLHGDQDILWEIHEKVVVKLYKRGALRQCVNTSGIGAWLKSVARNQAKDWIAKQGRKKRLPKRESENSSLSLSASVKGHQGITLEDTLQQSYCKGQERSKKRCLGEVMRERASFIYRFTFIETFFCFDR